MIEAAGHYWTALICGEPSASFALYRQIYYHVGIAKNLELASIFWLVAFSFGLPLAQYHENRFDITVKIETVAMNIFSECRKAQILFPRKLSKAIIDDQNTIFNDIFKNAQLNTDLTNHILTEYLVEKEDLPETIDLSLVGEDV